MSLSFPPAIAEAAPLLLWCSSHSTLAAEEIPLLLEAGFRVIPLLTDFWTFEYKPELDAELCNAWKDTVGLPADVVERLQAIKFCADMGQQAFDPQEIALLNQYVDVVYVTVLPNLAMRLAPIFKGTVIFRPFGHGHLNNYTRIAEHLKGDLTTLPGCHNFMWAPILSTLQEPEDPRLCMNPNQLSAFVTTERLGQARWSAIDSQPYVVETIPRIQKQPYYMEIYKQYRQDHGQLPLKILGGNPVAGGPLEDPAIVGFLEDEEYYRTAAQARVSLYHGTSRYHVHYHPIEFMALGVPVLFHQASAFAAEGERYGMSHQDLIAAGMYSSVPEANQMAQAALNDPALAKSWSQRQRFFVDEVFSRRKALDQARWIKRRTIQLRPWTEKALESKAHEHQANCSACPPNPQPQADIVHHNLMEQPKTKRPIPQRVVREFKRVLRKTLGSSRPDALRLEHSLHTPQLEQLVVESNHSQQAIQDVAARVDAAHGHLQHMAIDVQVIAQRYDQLCADINGLHQSNQEHSQKSQQFYQQVNTHQRALTQRLDQVQQEIRTHFTPHAKPEYKFYGQFTPQVDRFLFERYFPDTNIRGTFIECGAFDGSLECSCKFFEETMGWIGYNLEPSPPIFANLQRNRPQSKNYQIALSNRVGTATFKQAVHPQLGHNFGNGSLSHTLDHTNSLIESGCTFTEVEVELMTYRMFVQTEAIEQVDLFVLDVEGHELDVIEGMHGSSVLPDVMCVEVGHTPLSKVRSALTKLGYVYDISSHVNAFFVHQTKLPLFALRRACQ